MARHHSFEMYDGTSSSLRNVRCLLKVRCHIVPYCMYDATSSSPTPCTMPGCFTPLSSSSSSPSSLPTWNHEEWGSGGIRGTSETASSCSTTHL